jgi:hypothetical protein
VRLGRMPPLRGIHGRMVRKVIGKHVAVLRRTRLISHMAARLPPRVRPVRDASVQTEKGRLAMRGCKGRLRLAHHSSPRRLVASSPQTPPQSPLGPPQACPSLPPRTRGRKRGAGERMWPECASAVADASAARYTWAHGKEGDRQTCGGFAANPPPHVAAFSLKLPETVQSHSLEPFGTDRSP